MQLQAVDLFLVLVLNLLLCHVESAVACMDASVRVHGGSPLMSDQDTLQLVQRFRLKAVDLARQGIFGSLRTRVASLQSAWANLVSFLDHDSMPIMLYGERGTGKRRLVEEFLLLDNFSRKISGRELLKLKVFRGDFAVPGFTQEFLPSPTNLGNLIFVEHVDRLSASLQEELQRHYEIRRELSDKGIEVPRLILSTERALSLQVIQGRFSKVLFQSLTQFAVFLPSLHERQEDLPYLISALGKEANGKSELPSSEIMNRLSAHLWPENMDELRRVIDSMLSKNPDMRAWTISDLPSVFQPQKRFGFERKDHQVLATHYSERNQLRVALSKTEGNRQQAARQLGLSRKEFLEKMIRFGVR